MSASATCITISDSDSEPDIEPNIIPARDYYSEKDGQSNTAAPEDHDSEEDVKSNTVLSEDYDSEASESPAPSEALSKEPDQSNHMDLAQGRIVQVFNNSLDDRFGRAERRRVRDLNTMRAEYAIRHLQILDQLSYMLNQEFIRMRQLKYDLEHQRHEAARDDMREFLKAIDRYTWKMLAFMVIIAVMTAAIVYLLSSIWHQ
ncbi:hypothetical protein F5Y04DRAFT_289557 [Hypomontagnella monticulosa]|nr:hypothetical protein F5Y04DRAFT_289557 [Hypomontagnella monticulosa]